MSLTLVTAPTIEPVTLQEAKDHLRVDHADDDSVIELLIQSAREDAERVTWRALITQTLDLYLDSFPGSSYQPILIPRAPLQSVTSVTYTDTEGTSQTWASSNYTVDTNSKPGRLIPAYNVVWPSTQGVINAVKVRFVAGYGAVAQDVPASIRAAILLLVGHKYQHRETTIPGVSIAEIPGNTINALLMPHRVWI